MSIEEKKYECAVTGVVGDAAYAPKDDALGSTPVGWTEITIKRRMYNPQWLSVQQVKQAALQGVMQQIPAEMQQQQGWMMQLQVEAQFAALEAQIPMYLTTEDTVVVSTEDDASDALDEIRDILDLEPLDDDDERDDEPEDGESDEDDEDGLEEVGDE